LQARELGNELTDQSQADDRDPLSQRNIGDTHAIECNAAQSGETSMVKRNVIGNPGGEIAANGDGFSVSSSFAAVSDPIADFNIGYGGMFLGHQACAGIAEDSVFAEFCSYLGQSSDGRAFKRIPDFGDLGRVVGDRPDHAFLVDAGGFGTAADQRIDGANENVMRADHRVGDFVDDDILQPFSENLLH
jgi:hypothetical protein